MMSVTVSVSRLTSAPGPGPGDLAVSRAGVHFRTALPALLPLKLRLRIAFLLAQSVRMSRVHPPPLSSCI
jgi:hypothetical protein